MYSSETEDDMNI